MRHLDLILTAILTSALPASSQDLLANPRFDADLSGWTTVGQEAVWRSDDARGSPTSGSARLLQMCGTVTIRQCLVASANAYDFRVTARPTGDDVRVDFFADEGCSGTRTPGARLSFTATPLSSWTAFAWRVLRPPETRSLAVEASASSVLCEPCLLFPCPYRWFDDFSLTEAPAPPVGFFTLDPCRLLDTRVDGPPVAALADRTIVTAGACGIPSTARALALNITVTGATDEGDLRILASGAVHGDASAINYGVNQTRANNAIVARGAGGGLTVHSDQPRGFVHLVIDVTGYFE